MKINEHQMNELKHAVKTAALRNLYSNRYQFSFFDKMIQALGVRPSKNILKQAHTMIKEGRTAEEIGELVFGGCKLTEVPAPSRLNEVQRRLVEHIVYTFRRLFRQSGEGRLDSFLVMEAASYCYAMLGGPTPGECDINVLVSMLKDGSSDEQIVRWYMGDIAVAPSAA